MKIGVLDIQGSVEEHFAALGKLAKRLKFDTVLVKTVEDLNAVSGLIIPGGESTTLGKLLRKFGLREKIIERVRAGMAVWGTCAGAILLAKKIVGRENADSMGLMDIVIERNAYGRQLDSFETKIVFDFGKGGKSIPAVFIRAPKMVRVGSGVKVLAAHSARHGALASAKDVAEIVAARQQNMLATNFHPELTRDLSVHEYFVRMCSGNKP